ncbi:hypothetical protein Gohar_014567 [Gossypium harknessii]|uniref:Uncharacterized protein n=1 Tax=Gossypium harknessii TaxID=34285 RepID=A0A7J9FZ97_9ROSI|nr:hypothetical protein [Gossypium harknessii]
MATSARESRRRKILDRGSDRLAYITGQLQNLPTPPPHSHEQLHANPPPPQDPPTDISAQPAGTVFPPPSILVFVYLELKGLSPDINDEASSPVLPEHHPVSDADQGQTSAYNGGIDEGSASSRRDRSIEPSNGSAFDTSGEPNSFLVSSNDRSSPISTSGTVQGSETSARKHNFFSPKQISSAIDASEKARLLCSVIVGVVVVLLHLGFPLPGNKFLGSILNFRPLYLVLLTNVTLVMGRLLYSDHGSSQRTIGEEHKATSTDDYNWAEQLSKTLDVGLVAKKVVDAVFMDCSVYAIIVICGLSFT